MNDREKVIKGILQHCEGSMFDRCGECPYYEIGHEPFVCRDMLLNDLNELLKEQKQMLKEQEAEIAFLKAMQLQTVHNMSNEDIGNAVRNVLRL